MRCAVLLVGMLPVSLLAWNQQEDINVNCRYVVESVHVTGKPVDKLSPELRKQIDSVIGQNLDHGVLDRIAARLRRDLRVESVAVHVSVAWPPLMPSDDGEAEKRGEVTPFGEPTGDLADLLKAVVGVDYGHYLGVQARFKF